MLIAPPRARHACRLSSGTLLLFFLLAPVAAIASPTACVEVGQQPAAGHELPASERFDNARSLAQRGEFEAAIRAYRQLSTEHPADVDYLFGEAQARFWAGQAECALQLATRARSLAPDYEDIWRLEYQVRRVLDDTELEAFRRSAGLRFPGSAWLSESGAEELATVHWDAGITRESLDNGASDWQSLYAHIDRRSPDDRVMSLTLAEHRRFSLTDNEIAVGGGFRLAPAWLLAGSVRLVPHAEFLPDVVLDAMAGRQFGNGWNGGLNVRYRRYPDDTVSTFGVQVERYFGNYRVAWHLDNTRLASSSAFTHRGVLDYYSAHGSRFSLTVASGDEIEVIAPGQLLDMDISAIAVSGRHPVTERLSMTWRLGTHRQGSIYRRTHVGLSISGVF